MSNEKKELMKITVETPEKFESLASTTLETTQRLAKRINKLFSTAFVDYHGSVIHFIPGQGNAPWQQFMVELHFKPVAVGSVPASEDRVRAFKPITETAETGDKLVMELKNVFNSFNTSARFQLTSEAAQVLSEFMIPGTNIDPWNPKTYDQFKAEYQDQVMYGQAPIMVRITGLNLIALIRKIYGTKNAAGKRVEYGVLPQGPVNPTGNNQMVQSTTNWRLQILQLDEGKTFDIASEMGLIPAGNGGAIVTGF